jgi:hypothetical protein
MIMFIPVFANGEILKQIGLLVLHQSFLCFVSSFVCSSDRVFIIQLKHQHCFEPESLFACRRVLYVTVY